MNGDRRKSEEEERELDRKIALIREKNMKIEQRSKEIEADKLKSMEGGEKKKASNNSETNQESKASTSNGKDGKERQWDREWDKGKIPAEMWRENVPPMEMKGRLAKDKEMAKRQKQRPNNNSENHKLVNSEKSDKVEGEQKKNQRKENDNFVVKDIVRKLVNKVIYLEKQENLQNSGPEMVKKNDANQNIVQRSSQANA
ncbi:hypothetical protein WR25_06415 [Diploscapter pachys]|uniref:Uncharacterized protein n=1 Tax=Diploscapter pachys TaxID=2018661 RepID=A0A2A2LYX2_9BILA|nr:hypothetical protein WR25_06415 [Diploscapter pachys]